MRNMKMLGLLAISAMALVAFVGTSSASAAAKFTAGGAEAISTETLKPHVFSVTGTEVECETIGFTGNTTGTEATEQTVTPSYTNCTAFGFANATVDINGCEFTFKAATEGEPANMATVNLHGCGTGTEADKTKGIQITVNVPFFAKCTVDIPEQSITGAVSYTNTGSPAHTIDVTITATGVMADVTTSTGLCPLTTGTHKEGNGGSYTGESKVSTAKGISWDKE